MAAKPIRVLIIDDSLFFREFMARSLSSDFAIEVVGVVSDAREAAFKVVELNPDIIALDIDIKNIQYKDFIRWICLDCPHIRVIVISSPSANVFEALKAGAADFVAKPNVAMQMDNAGFIREVLANIKAVYAGNRASAEMPLLVAAASRAVSSASMQATGAKPAPLPTQATAGKLHFPGAAGRVIAIGASTGGTEAILSVVRELPAGTPGIVIVQHMPPVFTRMYAERLDKLCVMSAREARNGDLVRPGLILVAEGDKQMRLIGDGQGYRVKVGGSEKVSGHCPSVDVLFESVAATAGPAAVGVILTGMGRDGAKGLLKMREAGAHTIGQDEATSVVYGMPMVAQNLGAVAEQLPLAAIPAAILRRLV